MAKSSVSRVIELLVRVGALAAAIGCGIDEPGEETTGSEGQEATVCTTVAYTSPWWNQAFGGQIDPFAVELDATPSEGNIDGVVGISNGAANDWTQLAAIVRFNPQGFIDLRDGGAYRPSTYPYQAGVTYHIRIEVKLPSASYRVLVRRPGNYGYYLLGDFLAFRTEQQGQRRLDNVASFVTGGHGALKLCGVTMIWKPVCSPATPGSGFMSTAMQTPGPIVIASITATTTASNIDGVFGLASGRADDWNDFATSVRFDVSGVLQARDAGTYRADASIPYVAGDRFSVKMIANIAAKTYSVVVMKVDAYGAPQWDEPVTLATDYAFRPQQLAVTTLDTFVAIYNSPTGRMDACGTNSAPQEMKLAKLGPWTPFALANDAVLLMNGTTTQRLDASGNVTASIASTGVVATDASGNIYLSRAGDRTLFVEAYTASLAPRWSRTYAVQAFGPVTSAATTSAGDLVVSVYEESGSGGWLVRIGTDGSVRTTIPLPGASVVAVDTTGAYALARPSSTGLTIELYSQTGALQASRTIAGDFSTGYDVRMVRGPDRSIILAGHYHSQINFGDGTLYPSQNPESDTSTYLAVLEPTLATRFSTGLHTSYINGLAVNANRIVVSSELWTQFIYPELMILGSSGIGGHSWGDGTFDLLGLGAVARTGPVAIGASGRVYMNVWPAFFQSRFITTPTLVALSP